MRPAVDQHADRGGEPQRGAGDGAGLPGKLRQTDASAKPDRDAAAKQQDGQGNQ
jgi:hypothetical protein